MGHEGGRRRAAGPGALAGTSRISGAPRVLGLTGLLVLAAVAGCAPAGPVPASFEAPAPPSPATPSPAGPTGPPPSATQPAVRAAPSTTSGSAEPSATQRADLAPTGPTETVRVVRVIDGDTIEVALDGATARVRYIGIDTPEVSGRLEPLGPEATEANRRLVDGRTVVLERDVSETDRYGRLLRYVWLREADGSRWLLVNLALTAAGYALVSTVPPDVKYADLLLAAQREARARGVGLWGAVADDAGATPSASDRSGATDDERCDPAYPGVCIPPPPPDLDCRDIDARRFAVRPPDPHRFDGDGDGIGCEG